MNKHLGYTFGFILLLFLFTVKGVYAFTPIKISVLQPIDSIVTNAMLCASTYESSIQEYRSHLYVKGHLNMRKRNFTFRYLPKMFHARKGVDKYFYESHSELHYSSPNIYDQKVLASYGTTHGRRFQAATLENFNVNIYASTLFNNRLLSPLAKNARRYYRYHIDSVLFCKDRIDYKVRFTPKTKSDQLVGGWMIISDTNWSIREMRFSGRYGLFAFENRIEMGNIGDDDELLPTLFELYATFGLLGNVVDGSYLAISTYSEIKQKTGDEVLPREQNKYDLSDFYTLQCDDRVYGVDSLYFDTIRPIALTESERKLYDDYNYKQDSAVVETPKRSKAFWGSVGEFLVTDINLDLSTLGRVKCSPIINPLLLSYSKSNGFSWRQDFRYNRIFDNGRLIKIVPRIGYNFTRKEFYWSMSGDFEYLPQRLGKIHVSVGNGNRIYSSDVLADLKNLPDSVFDFNLLNLDYFHDLYFNLQHSIEVVNGLKVMVGASVHRRTPTKPSDLVITDPEFVVPPDVSNKIKKEYISFAPRFRVEWTPALYYYMNGRRKINLHSMFPTMSIDYERAFKGVFGSTGKYERIEFDIQHRVNLQLMRSLFYRIGVGAFTNQEEMYFVDFQNFTRSNLPMGWNDDIGGVFHLLDGRWYNSSSNYVRGHIVFESPFIFMRHMMKYSRYVQHERLYFSTLVVRHLKPYIEVGYGIGTHVFDFGVFVGFANWGYNEIGCKFTFELFNR